MQNTSVSQYPDVTISVSGDYGNNSSLSYFDAQELDRLGATAAKLTERGEVIGGATIDPLAKVLIQNNIRVNYNTVVSRKTALEDIARLQQEVAQLNSFSISDLSGPLKTYYYSIISLIVIGILFINFAPQAGIMLWLLASLIYFLAKSKKQELARHKNAELQARIYQLENESDQPVWMEG